MLQYTESASDKVSMDTFSYNWKDVDKQIKQAVANYDGAYKNIVKGINSEENRSIICELIELIDRYIQQPCKLYFEAQEALKHCFDRQGSCDFRLK